MQHKIQSPNVADKVIPSITDARQPIYRSPKARMMAKIVDFVKKNFRRFPNHTLYDPLKMDADPLQLLWILKGELESIAKDLQPPPPEEPEESDDIVTDNGLSKLEEESHPNEEDEKAQELESTHNNCNAKVHLDPEQHGLKMEELIRDYLTPAIKQLSRKKRKNKKNGMMRSQSQFGSPPPAISTTLQTNPGTSASPSVPSSPFLDIRDNLSDHANHHNNGNHQFVSSPHIPAAYDQSSSSNSHALSHQSHHHNNVNNHNRHSDHNQNYHHQPHQQHQQYPPSHPPHRIHFQPGEMMMDHVSNFSEQFGSCCRRFITSLVWYVFRISYFHVISVSVMSVS